jgi:hypothetical protein
MLEPDVDLIAFAITRATPHHKTAGTIPESRTVFKSLTGLTVFPCVSPWQCTSPTEISMKLRRLLLLVSVVTLLCGSVKTWAQTESPDLQQLKERQQRLEQEMQELKQQIQRLENAPAPAPPAPAAPAEPPQVPTTAEQPKNQENVPAAQEPKSTFRIYGYAQADSGYNFGQIDPNWFDVMRPSKLAAYRGQFAPDGTAFFSVRQTRFGVRSTTPTSLGELKTIFEFELFGTGVDAGQTTFRLRHAWGEIGQFGAGQTWSPFMDPDVFPNSLEYWGPNGMVFFRNIQFRWMPFTRGDSHIWIAAERPGASADGGVYSDRIELQDVRAKFPMPDFSVQAHWARKWGYLQVAGMFRKLTWEDKSPNPTFKLSGDGLGWGINTSSNIKFHKQQDTLRLQVVYGAGIQNYMNDAPIDVGIKNNFSNPISPIKGVPLPILGTVSFLDHNWSSKFSTAIGYSFANMYNSDGENPSDFHQGHYALTNLLFYPHKDVMVGGEFQYGRRINFKDGWNVNDYKLQFSAKFNFNKTFSY